jgi:5-hydroxyisourate hydrolase
MKDGWRAIAQAETDEHGDVHDWTEDKLERGAYRMVLDSNSYFANLGVSAAYPEVAVAFVIQDESDACQVQVLLAPYSYSMFFGARG